MIGSGEVIQYLKKNIPRDLYVSMFVAGSRPDKMIPKSDLDVFFVIDVNGKDKFFNGLTRIMKPLLGQNKEITYSFFRGPIKYEKKGLIHFLVYTSGETDRESKELFVNEHRTVLRSLLKSAEVVSGKPLRELLQEVDLQDDKVISGNKERSFEKLEILKKEGYVDYPEWKKTASGWKMLRTKKKARGFLKNYLINYYAKNNK